MRFIDTNIPLYAVSREEVDEPKTVAARALLSSRDLALSVQVLQEFYTQATRPTRPDPLTHQQALEYVTALERFEVQPMTLPLVHAALATRERFGISYWDAAIIEAARLLGCDQVLSEDLSHGQDYDGVTVVNPFL